MPLRLSENADAAPGYIQAFDVRTVNLPGCSYYSSPGEEGYDTWPAEAWKNTEMGGAKHWAEWRSTGNGGFYTFLRDQQL